MLPKKSAAAMQGIFDAQDLFVSSQLFKVQQYLSLGNQTELYSLDDQRAIGLISPFNTSPFQDTDNLRKHDKYKGVHSEKFSAFQIKENIQEKFLLENHNKKCNVSRFASSSAGNYTKKSLFNYISMGIPLTLNLLSF